ncbi:hypothetical protein ACFWZW_05525 [Microbacterium enclense]|uniref:hypothetical protein n=1 Tax=Microbacterium enclense TaxID=993073 RepID=UPI0036D99EDF
MSFLTRPKNTAPKSAAPTDAVPAELAEAYEAATPDIAAFMKSAASQLASEHRRRQNPDSGAAIIVYPEDRQRMYTDHLPELLVRAEHLARLSAARAVALQADLESRHQKYIAEQCTCPLCHETSTDIRKYSAPDVTGITADAGAPRMCPACRYTADLIFWEARVTPERQAAVRAGLEITAQSA